MSDVVGYGSLPVLQQAGGERFPLRRSRRLRRGTRDRPLQRCRKGGRLPTGGHNRGTVYDLAEWALRDTAAPEAEATEGRHVGHLAPVSDLHDEVACNAHGDMLYIKDRTRTGQVRHRAVHRPCGASAGRGEGPHTAQMTLNNCMPTRRSSGRPVDNDYPVRQLGDLQ